MSDTIDFVGYVTFFWMFVFSGRFRQLQAEEWRNGGFLERGEILVQAITSAILGVGLLYAIAALALSH